MQGENINLVAELLGYADPAITASIYLHTDAKMHNRAGMRQNRRVVAAPAKADQDSRLVRESVKTFAGLQDKGPAESHRAEVAELVDALDSKSGAPEGRAGSIPAFGTIFTPQDRLRGRGR